MAKKPMTKSQIVSYFASKFVLPKKAASVIIDEVQLSQYLKPRKQALLPFLG